MTQQPIQVSLTAADIANAIMQTVVQSQTTYTYLAAVLAQMGGSADVDVDTVEALRNEDKWEVVIEPIGEGKVQFRLIRGEKEILNARLGRTPGGIIVP